MQTGGRKGKINMIKLKMKLGIKEGELVEVEAKYQVARFSTRNTR